jgi:antirestriction protein ArdC
MSSSDAAKLRLEQVDKQLEVLMKDLEAGKSEALTTWLVAMARFHNYSFYNQWLIFAQFPEATRVAGYKKWETFKRRVKKGEKSIQILAPTIVVVREKDDNGVENKREQLVGFHIASVFDVSQTEGEDLAPDPMEAVSGEPGKAWDRLLEAVKKDGCVVDLHDETGPCGGRCNLLTGQIWVNTSHANGRKFGALAHEWAHWKLHGRARDVSDPEWAEVLREVAEVEAESVSFVVGTRFGIDFGRAASDYLLSWKGDKEMLKKSLDRIRRISMDIIDAVEYEAEEKE